ncbi:MAG: bifunctional proline dehydrogenase/L-glutamate gamma-semialdehyde dehydrogenase [Desulfatitalea sp.]
METPLSAAFIADTIQLAAQWQERANQLLTPRERTRQERLEKLLNRPTDKITLVKLLDQSLRSRDPARVADQIGYLLRRYGIPRFFSTLDRGLLLFFQGVGRHLPRLTIPKLIAKIREQSRPMIVPGEIEALHPYLSEHRSRSIHININHIGEAVLGEAEARRRLDVYKADLQNPLIENVSVKISTIYSQLNPLACAHDVQLLKKRLGALYHAAQHDRFVRPDGTATSKTVHLDMEAYPDLAVTVAAFKETLDQKELQSVTAGIVLQAYLPESYALQQELTRWALLRAAQGGAPIRLRIVKGANLEMERIDAALNGWPLAPYDNKPDVDANFKRMLLFGLRPEHIRAVRLGVASHNLFDLALARRVAQADGVEAFMMFEMLAGMADHVQRALGEAGCPLLLYTPVAGAEEFPHAVAYLIRRMDENTGPGNYLRHAPNLNTGSDAWRLLADDFKTACARIPSLDEQPHRIQNRLAEGAPISGDLPAAAPFINEPDTDWSLAANRQWAERIRSQWKKNSQDPPVEIGPVVAGRPVENDLRRSRKEIFDLNQLPERICLARCDMAAADDIQQAIAVARQDPDGWRAHSLDQHREILSRVAVELRRARGDLIGAAAAETGKIFAQADSEVSEAVDFVEYYPRSMAPFEASPHLDISAKGAGVVVSPWNFPIAIPCGGISAALAAGNTVILKPASAAILTAWRLCQCFWRAGVSQNTLQFLPCEGAVADRHLIGHSEVDFVILTGGTATAKAMLRRRPDLALSAETGGKNTTLVTAMADRDQAIKNVIQSAFSHSGQKCSATSLLILEKEVYDDPQFKRTLVDAAASLAVGSVWRFENRLGPLIQPPGDVLLRGLTRLEPGEEWALEPRNLGGNPHLWSPGIKWHVRPGSFTHRTELFGPVLGVMRAENLDSAIEWANQTGYGLTAAIESLDPREIAHWQKAIRAGNLYINRGTTGAVTLRQPFGGWGLSAVGPALKAGGPHYVAQFLRFKEQAAPAPALIVKEHPLLGLAQRWERKCRWGRMGKLRPQMERIVQAIRSYLHHAYTGFEVSQDPFHLRGEDNHLRHRPVGRVAVCVHPDDTLFEVVARVAAGLIAGCHIVLYLPPGLENDVSAFLNETDGRLLTQKVELVTESDGDLIHRLPKLDRLRYAAAERVPATVYAAAAEANIYIARAPVLMDGRIELLHYYLSQTVSNAYHRAGNLGERGLRRMDD